MRLLLVEDSDRMRHLLGESIHDAGWRLDSFGDAGSGEEAAAMIPYDLAMIDLGLPDGDGLELVRRLRQVGFGAPILILTARGSVGDRIRGLDAGADDYLVKPFNHAELLARCRALLRRAPQSVDPVIVFGNLSFDTAVGALARGDVRVVLTPRERALIELLMRNAGSVVARERMEASLSEFGSETSANALELTLARLRRKLVGVQALVSIETVRGVGYLLREPM